jgi:hypothetical protein
MPVRQNVISPSLSRLQLLLCTQASLGDPQSLAPRQFSKRPINNFRIFLISACTGWRRTRSLMPQLARFAFIVQKHKNNSE